MLYFRHYSQLFSVHMRMKKTQIQNKEQLYLTIYKSAWAAFFIYFCKTYSTSITLAIKKRPLEKKINKNLQVFTFYACLHFNSLQLKSLHWSLLLLEHKLLLTFIHLRCNTGILFFNTKVMLYEFKSLLVDFLVFMPLKKFNFIKS